VIQKKEIYVVKFEDFADGIKIDNEKLETMLPQYYVEVSYVV
jgi:hypothetical protein